MMPATASWKFQLQVPAAAVDLFSATLEPFALAVASFGNAPDGIWTIEAYAVHCPDPARLAASLRLAAAASGIDEPLLRCEPLPHKDWLAENLASFRPVRAGRYFVHPSHYAGVAPAGTIAIEIDAATAFGSGAHGSTYGCLSAIDCLAPKLARGPALDVGCGSGILAIAIAKLGCRRVVASDIDPEAVRVCRGNLRNNAVAARVEAICAGGLRDRRIRAQGSYRLIVANILARPLMLLARDIAACLEDEGRIVLSGLLASQEPMVLAPYRRCGLMLDERITVDDWRTLILRR
jgi:ribosomal protein L11 methyltransferase